MDPKTPQNLDPKLKEAYDRVMGMAANNATPVQPPAAVNPAPQMAAPQTAMPGVQGGNPAQSFMPQQPGTYPPMGGGAPAGGTPMPGMGAPATSTAPATGTHAAKPSHHSSPVMTVVYIICGIIFLLAYAVFWVKILNFELPFPLPF